MGNKVVKGPIKALKAACVAGICGLIVFSACNNGRSEAEKKADNPVAKTGRKDTVITPAETVAPAVPLDTALYNKLQVHLANGDSSGRWPVKTAYPDAGALLPFNRIVAYYGNLYSKNMGILGEYPPGEMLQKLKGECKRWQEADPTIKVLPALHYIAVTAQGSAGKDGKYRARGCLLSRSIPYCIWQRGSMPSYSWTYRSVSAMSRQRCRCWRNTFKLPNVHLGIDPEFAMSKSGRKPGSVIGTLDASDANWCVGYLTRLVKENNLPPKILVFHRFTKNMLTDARKIHPTPQVQFVLDMDGWGPVSLKTDSYRSYVADFPIEFTGFKLFYKNDTKMPRGVKLKETPLMTPKQVLAQKPSPIYIQYQ